MADEPRGAQPVNEMTGSPEQAAGTQPPQKGRGRQVLIITAVLLVLTLFGLRWWVRGKTHIETDNAFVEANVVSLSAKVPGTVRRVLVADNQHVRQGDLLVELDDNDLKAQLSQAEASVGVARNESGGDYQKAQVAKASVDLARARLEQAEVDLQRGEALFAREVIPREQLDRLRTARRMAGSQFRESEEALKRARAEAGLSATGSNQAKVAQRQAQVEQARLQLSYTRIVAPADGFITRKSVEPGANVQPGQPLMALVPLREAWVTANYKESQLAHIRPGQLVEMTVDAYPGRTFSGRVESIMAGTGAAFSLLPPENATGNYVKVVQRVPVKITIDSNSDPEHLLRVGMSVVPTVLVGRSTTDVLKDLFR